MRMVGEEDILVAIDVLEDSSDRALLSWALFVLNLIDTRVIAHQSKTEDEPLLEYALENRLLNYFIDGLHVRNVL